MKYKVILWDFDGTLADTGADVWDSLEYAAGKLRGSMDEKFKSCDSNLGKPMAEIFGQVHPFPGEEKLSTFDKWVTIHYRTISEYPKTEFYPGICEILEEARAAGVRNYIITLKPEEALLRILRKKGWAELFEGCFSPDSFGEEIRSKTQVIADVMDSGQMERESTVYIGDTFSDVTAAHANSIPCIGVTYGDGDTEKLLKAEPDKVAKDAVELKKILQEEEKIMLNNFDICINTRFIFGKGAENQIGEILKKDGVKKILIHHDNGQYLYDTGLLQAVRNQLTANGIAHIELGGVLPNPRLSLAREGIELAKKEGVDLILAIGGGSVIDSAKAIGLGTVSEGDVWDYFIGKREPEHTLPVAVLLTCPATGSESSQVAVVNNTDEGRKLLVSHPVLRPKYAFMDPELTYSLPKFLTACGVTDMFSHVCERYFAPDDEIGVIDRMSEGILKTLVDIGPKLLEDRQNYTYRAEIMWIGTIAHNNTVGIGRVQDWVTHEIGNELSALYDTPHGATLSIIMGSWMRYVYKQKPERFARYAREVFGVNWDGTNTLQAAEEGIVKTEEYFQSMGMPISFHDMKIPTDRIEDMLDRIAFRGADNSIGGIVRLNRDDCRKIYEMAF